MFRYVVNIVAVETVIVVNAADVVNVVVIVTVTNCLVGREKRIDGFKENDLVAVSLVFPISRADA